MKVEDPQSKISSIGKHGPRSLTLTRLDKLNLNIMKHVAWLKMKVEDPQSKILSIGKHGLRSPTVTRSATLKLLIRT